MRTFVPGEAAGRRRLAALAPAVTVLDVQSEPHCISLTVTPTASTAACPDCATSSARIHSYYTRHPADLPITGRSTRLVLHVRRFRCLNPACPTATFAERLPNLVAPAAQRTVRLNAALRDRALAFGGQAGSRQSARSAMAASGATLLRRAHTATPPTHPTPRVLGSDDFAFRKGRVYGTILTDGETHAVVDRLPDRSAATVAAWLATHPEVELVTRDRSTEYARGVSAGAPDVRQVADRWHVLGNLREAVERLLHRLRPQILLCEAEVPPALPLTSVDRDRRRGTLDQVRQQAYRAQGYARYADVKRRQADGKASIQIARELKLSRQTVRTYMASERFPEHARPRQQRSLLDPYVDVLQARWDAGCHDNQQLVEAIRAAGYRGSIRAVVQWTMLRRPLLTGYLNQLGGSQRAWSSHSCRQRSTQGHRPKTTRYLPHVSLPGCCSTSTIAYMRKPVSSAPSCVGCTSSTPHACSSANSACWCVSACLRHALDGLWTAREVAWPS